MCQPGGKISGVSFFPPFAPCSSPLLALTPNSWALLSPSLPSCANSPPKPRKMRRSIAFRRNSVRAGTKARDLSASSFNASSSAVLALNRISTAASSALAAACRFASVAASGSRRQPGSTPDACRGTFAAGPPATASPTATATAAGCDCSLVTAEVVDKPEARLETLPGVAAAGSSAPPDPNDAAVRSGPLARRTGRAPCWRPAP
mmetsp:Transcript_29471/g.79571  ORF Transcript_29471/g.79571 Transcript_29471/m.79571 type:complete len:205 (+) Transcript_29471:775-1389(+)